MRIRSITLVVMIALLAWAVSGSVFASPADKPSPATITVTGHAEAAVVPDVAVVTAGIVTTGPDVESARGENDRTMRRMIDALVAQGIDRTTVSTSQFSLQPIYRTDAKDGGQGSISGYRLQNNIAIVVEDLSKIGAVIDTAFAAGANQFQGLRFGLKDDSRLRDELLKQAVQDGRRKAAIIADSLGVTLGPPLAISEAGRMAPVAADAFRTMKAGQAGTPVEAGSITLGVDVNLVFAM